VRRAGFALGLASLLVLAACRARESPRVIRLGHEADVLGLDPITESDDATASILSNVFEPLVVLDADVTLRPALAVSWTSPDENTWLFELRSGVTFHDGHSLTAAVVVNAMERARTDPASKVRGYLASVVSIEAADGRTVRFRTRTRDPLLLNRLASIPILRAGASGAPPSGTGPYRIVRWQKGERLEAEAFSGYWGGAPAIARVEFVPLPSAESILDALAHRRVDVVRSVSEAAEPRAAALRGVQIVSRPGLWNRYIWMRTLPRASGTPNPFADPRVRRAISLALDRGELARRVGGHASPANQLVPPGVFGYLPGLPEPPRDLAAARKLLAAAGYEGGFETPLAYAPALANAAAAEGIRQMLGEAGIRVKPTSIPREEIFQRWQAGESTFFLGAWLFDSMDATSFLRDCVATRDSTRGTGTFNAGFSSPALDRLIEENAAIPGPQLRAGHYARLMPAVMDEMPMIPLYTEANVFAVSDRVVFRPRFDGRLLAFEMSLR
jgi:peptide/nickel transport system substrate-binding protein